MDCFVKNLKEYPDPVVVGVKFWVVQQCQLLISHLFCSFCFSQKAPGLPLKSMPCQWNLRKKQVFHIWTTFLFQGQKASLLLLNNCAAGSTRSILEHYASTRNWQALWSRSWSFKSNVVFLGSSVTRLVSWIFSSGILFSARCTSREYRSARFHKIWRSQLIFCSRTFKKGYYGVELLSVLSAML